MSNQIADNTAIETVDAQYWVNQYEALQRLRNNEDFKAVILNGYLKDKALNGVSLLAHPSVKQRNERPNVMEELVAISNLEYHLYMIDQLGSIAKEDAEEAEFGEDEE